MDDINKKILAIEGSRKVNEQILNGRIEENAHNLETTNEKLNQLETLSKSFDSYAKTIKDQLTSYFKEIQDFKRSILEDQLKVKEENNMNVMLLRKEVLKADDKIAEIHAIAESHLDEIKRHDLSSAKMRRHIDDITG